jgi:hypothetical protein
MVTGGKEMRRELAPFSHRIAAGRGENSKALRLRLAGHDIGLRAVAMIRGAAGARGGLYTLLRGVRFSGPPYFIISQFWEDYNEYFKN